MRCCKCNGRVAQKASHTYNDEVYCEDCFCVSFFYCSNCGCKGEKNNSYSYKGELYCKDCFSHNFSYCDTCGEIFSVEDMWRYYNSIHCNNCFHEVYFHCDSCGDAFLLEEQYQYGDNIYCYRCYNEERGGEIEPFDYKPTPIFHKFPYENTLYMGVELEYNNLDDKVSSLMRKLDLDSRKLYFKRDSSVNSGFEIVSHPMTLAKHREFGWEQILKLACDNGASVNGGGLHIHMQKCSALEYAKMKAFFGNNREFIFLLSRRTRDEFKQWSRILEIDTPKKVLEDVKNGEYYHDETRYVALNPTKHTIELRIFRSTKTKNYLYAAMEFCHSFYVFVKTMSYMKLCYYSCLEDYLSFIKENREYKELRKYLLKKVFENAGWGYFVKILERKNKKNVHSHSETSRSATS